MNIVGPDELIFGVQDLNSCSQYLTDYGLRPVDVDAHGGRYEALDGTAVVLRRADDINLPAAPNPACLLRETVYGVGDMGELDAIATELRKDRQVTRGPGSSVSCVDDAGYALTFRLSIRHPFDARPNRLNAPGAPPQRPVNELGIWPDMPAVPRSLSHIVLFVPDATKAEAFYHRLGFRTTDRFIGTGPFLRPAGTLEHHTLFLIETKPFMGHGLEHFTFHLGSGTEVLLAGTRFERKGYRTFWGPGRHVLGSNWFWYFNSPLNCHVEYDADMDLHDDRWVARDVPVNADNSQLFLFTRRDKWVPGDPLPPAT